MYAEDSFHTLSGIGQIGLVAVSVLLSIAVLWLLWWLARGKPLLVRMALALLMFFAFVWLSPQVYYTYYLTLFDGLPRQVVVKSPPDPSSLLALLSFTGSDTLSAHSQGVLGWLMLVLAALRRQAVSDPEPDDRV